MRRIEITIGLVAVLLIAGFCIISFGASEPDEFVPETSIAFEINDNTVPAKFSKKVDGDTAYFTVNGNDIKVRFLAIDTPETVKAGTEVQPYGPEASEYTASRLQNADEIYLEYDDESDRTDAYGRDLAWVWVEGSLLEEELVSLGYAKVDYIYGDYKYVNDLYAVEDEAKEQGLGIWQGQED